MKQFFLLLFIAGGGALFFGCASPQTEHAKTGNGLSWTVEELTETAKEASSSAQHATEASEIKNFAQRGREFAEKCIERAPEEAACYYYRATHVGLYYKAHIFGYQDGVKQMISDCERAISIDPSYDYAGCHRLLGQLYTNLPKTTARSNGIIRDLSKAEQHLREALRIAPEYPENHLALSENLLAQGNVAASLDALVRAKKLAPQWKLDTSFRLWEMTAHELEKKIAQVTQ